MSRVSDAQVIDLMTRRNLPEGDAKFISGEDFQAFLEGRLTLRPNAALAGRIIDVSDKVELLIKAGYHTAAGMTAKKYRALWPKTVTQPVEYAGRFDQVLLVDRSIDQVKLTELGKTIHYVQPSAYEDLVAAPVGADGQPLTRYVAFVQLGEKNLSKSVETCRMSFAPDEVGLVTAEGLHLPVQHGAYLRRLAVDLAGSGYGGFSAPYVHGFDGSQPRMFARDVRAGRSIYGSGSRGSVVIAVR